MGGRTQYKNRHISMMELSCNAKEEILLNKRLRILESMKRQAENSRTLDQRILYNRFTTKLRRSEMAHAKRLGNQDLVRRLSQSLFPLLHTAVNDGSKEAVRRMLQKAEASQIVPTPCRIQSHLAPISSLKNLSPTDLQGKRAETEGQQNSLGFRERKDAQGKEPKWKTSSERQALSRYTRPHTTNDQKPDRLYMKIRWQEGFTKSPCQSQQPASQATELRTTLSLEEPADEVMGKDLPESECRNFKSGNPTLRSTSRNFFLGLDDMPLDMSSKTDSHRTADNCEFLNNKIQLFIQKTTALKQEQSSLSQDYYSDRLLEKLGRKCQNDQDFLYSTEEEWRKWDLVGPEPNHRSITIQKLDRNIIRQFSGGTDTMVNLLKGI